MDFNRILDQNRRAWDDMVRRRQRFTHPAREDDLRAPLQTVDAKGWLGGDITGKRVLCLAAGGGRQSALYAKAGAEVTVVDISEAMIELDRKVAAELRLPIRALVGSMHDLSMLGDNSFDIVIQPVSTCYVPDVKPVYEEVARVICVGGVYISQHKQPVSMQSSLEPSPSQRSARPRYVISEPYYREGPLPAVRDANLVRETGTLEFLHRWSQLIGEMCRAGFAVEDLTEPFHAKGFDSRKPDVPPREKTASAKFEHRSAFVPPYVRIKAMRVERGESKPAPKLVLPGT